MAIIQSDPFNESALATTLKIALSKNLRLAGMPGNVFLPKADTGLPKDSVANVTALLSLDKADCRVVEGTIPSHLMCDVDAGLRTVLALTTIWSALWSRSSTGPRVAVSSTRRGQLLGFNAG